MSLRAVCILGPNGQPCSGMNLHCILSYYDFLISNIYYLYSNI